jgi:DNA-binding NarL/FixJ family response regulator
MNLITRNRIEDLVRDTPSFAGFHNLMLRRVSKLLVVCSLYDYFILEQDGSLLEQIVSQYVSMNLSYTPLQIHRAGTGTEALAHLQRNPVDIVLTMYHLPDMCVNDFASNAKDINQHLNIFCLIDDAVSISGLDLELERGDIDRFFLWTGNPHFLLSMLKLSEDRLNVDHDTHIGGVRIILLIEDNIHFYSSYLPIIYTEIVKQTQRLMGEGLNAGHRLLRQRARPKILLATSYEEAWDIYKKYHHYLLGIISDVRFPREGVLDESAGYRFIETIKKDSPDIPVLLQSSQDDCEICARSLNVSFCNKNSRHLLKYLQYFILNSLGFGDFVFRLPTGEEVGRVADLKEMIEFLPNLPDNSLQYHAERNHFSNWLRARTEFQLADRLRPLKIPEFESMGHLRQFLIEVFIRFRESRQRGIITDFSRRHFDKSSSFVRIGSGSIGGKARGLAFVNALIQRHQFQHRFEGVEIFVPLCAVIGTEVFDTLIEINDLWPFLLASPRPTHTEVIQRFLDAEFPQQIADDLRAFLTQVKYPLAVRSSSILEDSRSEPFAGIYETQMIPNNHPELEQRLQQLCHAIKLVYASMFSEKAYAYLEATGHHIEQEKMAVVIQELLGKTHDNRFYPSFAGVAQSHNFYPIAQLEAKDGIAHLAIGLGCAVVESGQALSFSPAHPRRIPQLFSSKAALNNTQRVFFALNLDKQDLPRSAMPLHNLDKYDLDIAEQDGVLQYTGSVYSPENQMFYDGVNRSGPRVVTFAHILNTEVFPLAKILKFLLEICSQGMNCEIEIEFAVQLDVSSGKPQRFGFLQLRPLAGRASTERIDIGEYPTSEIICSTDMALGNGRIREIRDIIYVRNDRFKRSHSSQVATEIGQLNNELKANETPYILIGPGRWGSSDPWLGIPVSWNQISAVRLIVEVSFADFIVTPSQGSHFFQNLLSLKIGYMTINAQQKQGFIDWSWLDAQTAVRETTFLRHISLDNHTDIIIDGRCGRGTIIKPQTKLNHHS